MEISEYKRISLGENWWFAIQPDKMIFGGNFLPDGIHCTFSFGLKSGFFDLHLRKDLEDGKKVYFQVARISTKELVYYLDPLKLKLLNSVLIGIEEISEKSFIENAIGFITLHDENQLSDEKFINEVLIELITPKNKRKLSIDHHKPEFNSKAQNFAEKYAEKWNDKIQNPLKIQDMNFGTGILIKKDLRRMFVKIPFGQDYRIFLLESLDLDHTSVLRKFFGDELFEFLKNRFNAGLDKLKDSIEPQEFDEFVLSISTAPDTPDS
jgi:hypothetical protein